MWRGIFFDPLMELALEEGSGSTERPLELYFLDVGYGDSLLIRFPNGQCALVDGGGPDRGDRVCSAIRALGIDRLEYLILTHFHKDHAGGLLPVLNRFFPAGTTGKILLTHFPEAVHPAVEPVLAELQTGPVRFVKAGERFNSGNAFRFEILHPGDLSGEPNEDSMVMQITHREVKILLPADIQEIGQAELIRRYGDGLRSDLVKIPHHAGEGLPEFVDTVRAKDAVLSVGPNRRDLPNPEVLEQYRRIGCRIHRTDEIGTVSMISDGRSIRRSGDHSPVIP